MKILDSLAVNRDRPVLKKIYAMKQFTLADIRELERILWKELGDKEDYDRYTAGMPCGPNVAIFIRSVIGVDRKEAVERFSKFLSGAVLNSEQEEFLMTIISYVCENGDITKEIVVNEYPFDERLSVFSTYMMPLAKYIDNIHNVINPAFVLSLATTAWAEWTIMPKWCASSAITSRNLLYRASRLSRKHLRKR